MPTLLEERMAELKGLASEAPGNGEAMPTGPVAQPARSPLLQQRLAELQAVAITPEEADPLAVPELAATTQETLAGMDARTAPEAGQPIVMPGAPAAPPAIQPMPELFESAIDPSSLPEMGQADQDAVLGLSSETAAELQALRQAGMPSPGVPHVRPLGEPRGAVMKPLSVEQEARFDVYAKEYPYGRAQAGTLRQMAAAVQYGVMKFAEFPAEQLYAGLLRVTGGDPKRASEMGQFVEAEYQQQLRRPGWGRAILAGDDAMSAIPKSQAREAMGATAKMLGEIATVVAVLPGGGEAAAPSLVATGAGWLEATLGIALKWGAVRAGAVLNTGGTVGQASKQAADSAVSVLFLSALMGAVGQEFGKLKAKIVARKEGKAALDEMLADLGMTRKEWAGIDTQETLHKAVRTRLANLKWQINQAQTAGDTAKFRDLHERFVRVQDGAARAKVALRETAARAGGAEPPAPVEKPVRGLLAADGQPKPAAIEPYRPAVPQVRGPAGPGERATALAPGGFTGAVQGERATTEAALRAVVPPAAVPEKPPEAPTAAPAAQAPAAQAPTPVGRVKASTVTPGSLVRFKPDGPTYQVTSPPSGKKNRVELLDEKGRLQSVVGETPVLPVAPQAAPAAQAPTPAPTGEVAPQAKGEAPAKPVAKPARPAEAEAKPHVHSLVDLRGTGIPPLPEGHPAVAAVADATKTSQDATTALLTQSRKKTTGEALASKFVKKTTKQAYRDSKRLLRAAEKAADDAALVEALRPYEGQAWADVELQKLTPAPAAPAPAEAGGKAVTRETFKADMQAAFNLTDQQAVAVDALAAARAEQWAAENPGKTADDWYAENIAGVDTKEPTKATAMLKPGERRSAAVEFNDDGKAILHGLEKPTVASAVHELGHVFLEGLPVADQNAVAADAGVADFGKAKAGDKAAWKRVHERFARGFERYLRTGKAPTAKLKAVFESFKKWLHSIYARIKGSPIDVKISPRVKAVFDRMLGGKGPLAVKPAEIAKREAWQMSRREWGEALRKLREAATVTVDDLAPGDVIQSERYGQRGVYRVDKITPKSQLIRVTELDGETLEPTAKGRTLKPTALEGTGPLGMGAKSRRPSKFLRVPKDGIPSAFRQGHAEAVREALDEGKSVPEEVLADYRNEEWGKPAKPQSIASLAKRAAAELKGEAPGQAAIAGAAAPVLKARGASEADKAEAVREVARRGEVVGSVGDLEGEGESQHVAGQIFSLRKDELTGKREMFNDEAYKEIAANLKRILRDAPELAEYPFLEVGVHHGEKYLAHTGTNYRIRFAPAVFGIDAANLTEGQQIAIPLERFGIDAAKYIKQAQRWAAGKRPKRKVPLAKMPTATELAEGRAMIKRNGYVIEPLGVSPRDVAERERVAALSEDELLAEAKAAGLDFEAQYDWRGKKTADATPPSQWVDAIVEAKAIERQQAQLEANRAAAEAEGGEAAGILFQSNAALPDRTQRNVATIGLHVADDLAKTGKLTYGRWSTGFLSRLKALNPDIANTTEPTLPAIWDDMRTGALEHLGENQLPPKTRTVMQDYAVAKRIQEARTAGEAEAGPPVGGVTLADEDTLASAVADHIPMRKQATTTETASIKEIVDTMSRTFGLPLRVGRFRHPGASGIYKRLWKVARSRDYADLGTWAHEVTHHAFFEDKLSKTLPAEVKAEVRALDYEEGKRRLHEGFAEFGRLYLTNEQAAKDNAPKTYKWFTETYLSTSRFGDAYRDGKRLIDTHKAQGSLARVRSQIDRQSARWAALGRIISDPVGTLGSAWRWTVSTFIDRNNPLWRAMYELAGTRQLAEIPAEYQFAPMAKIASMAASTKARQATLSRMIDFMGNRVGPGLQDIIRPIAADIGTTSGALDLEAYLYARHAIDVHAAGKNPGIHLEDAKAVVEALGNRPGWEKAADGITKWHDQLLDYVIDAGGLSEEGRAKMRKLYPHYIPLLRSFDAENLRNSVGAGGQSLADLPSAVKRLAGDGRPILDVLESSIKYAERMIALSDKIRVGRMMVDAAKHYREMGPGKLVEEVSPQLRPVSTDVRTIASQLKAAGVELADADLDATLTVFENIYRGGPKDNIIALWRDGKMKMYQVRPDIYRAMTTIDKDFRLGPILDVVLGMPARALRLGATGLRAGFALITNPLRDPQTAAMQTRVKGLKGTLPGIVLRSGAAIYKDLTDADIAILFKAGGGEMGQPLAIDRKFTQEAMQEVLAIHPKDKALNWAAHPIDSVRRFFSLPELGPRLAEFEGILQDMGWKPGQDLTIDQYIAAQMSAANVTVDFREGGNFSMFLNRMTAFHNASIQGPHRMFDAFRRHPVASTIRALLWVTLPSLALWWYNKDEEWYKQLPAWEKYRYYHIRTPFGVMRIPRPFEWGMIFGSMAEGLAEWAYSNDPKHFEEALGETFEATLPPILPTVGVPAVEVFANRDMFRARPLVSRRLEGLEPKDQYYLHTTETAKTVGRLFNVSPAKVEHLLYGYTGGLAVDVTRAAEVGARAVGLAKPKAESANEATDIPVIGRLFIRSTTTRVFDDFYSTLDQLSRQAASEKLAKRRLPLKEKMKLARLQRTGLALAEMRQQERDLAESALPDHERWAKSAEIRKRMLDVAYAASTGKPLASAYIPRTADDLRHFYAEEFYEIAEAAGVGGTLPDKSGRMEAVDRHAKTALPALNAETRLAMRDRIKRSARGTVRSTFTKLLNAAAEAKDKQAAMQVIRARRALGVGYEDQYNALGKHAESRIAGGTPEAEADADRDWAQNVLLPFLR